MEATKGYKVELIKNCCEWQSGAKRTKHVSLHVDYGVRLAKLFYSTPEPTVKGQKTYNISFPFDTDLLAYGHT